MQQVNRLISIFIVTLLLKHREENESENTNISNNESESSNTGALEFGINKYLIFSNVYEFDLGFYLLQKKM